MKITDLRTTFEPGNIQKGPYANHKSYYRDALYSTLMHLKPKICLEIGTHIGQSSTVFTEYFDKAGIDGILITIDIKIMCDLTDKRIQQVVVHPCVSNSSSLHYVKDHELLPTFNTTLKAILTNMSIIRKSLSKAGYDIETQFDFAFIDGDHQRESFYADIFMCEQLTKNPHFMFIDNVEDTAHDSCTIYHEEIKNDPGLCVYDYSDWDRFTETVLIWKKENEDCSIGDAL